MSSPPILTDFFCCFTLFCCVISMVVGRPSLLRDIRGAADKSHKFHVRACLLHHALRRRPPFIYKALALHNAIVIQTCETTRYLLRSTYRATSANEFVFSLSSISAREFLALFRLTRVQFDVLLQTISQHPALLSQQSLRKTKVPAANQLLVFLNFFGSHQTLSQVALRFKIGLGSVGNYVNNITVALRALAPVLIAWPDEQERQLLKDSRTSDVPGRILDLLMI